MVASGQDDSALFCTTCGYDITGLRECRCPECGTQFELLKLREENRQLSVNPRRVVFQFFFFPVTTIALTAFLFLWIISGYWAVIELLALSVFGGMLLSVFAGYFAAVKLARYTNLPASKGIAGKPSIVVVLFFWLVLSIIACSSLWYIGTLLMQTIPPSSFP